MNILAIEGSSPQCSVAINVDGDMTELIEIKPRQHNQRLLPLIEQVLSDAQLSLNELDAIAVGVGPGSFTGIRLVVALVQGFSFSQQVPVIPVSSLLVLAQSALLIQPQAKQLLPAIDARMQQVYWQQSVNHGGEVAQIQAEQCSSVEVLLTELPEAFTAVGDAWQRVPELQAVLSDRAVEYVDCYPRAKALAVLAETQYQNKAWVSADELVPNYLGTPKYAKSKQC